MNKKLANKRRVVRDDLLKLFNYPSIGELFSEGNSQHLDEFRKKLKTACQDLEQIIRHGKRDEAESAKQALRAVEVTLEFLQTLQDIK